LIINKEWYFDNPSQLDQTKGGIVTIHIKLSKQTMGGIMKDQDKLIKQRGV
jgi:hypothetical protein